MGQVFSGISDCFSGAMFYIVFFSVFLLLLVVLFVYYVCRARYERARSYSEIDLQKNKLDMILECTGIGTWEWNMQTDEHIINANYARIFGYELAELEPITFDTWRQLVYPEDLQGTFDLLDVNKQGLSKSYHHEYRGIHKDGSIIWILDRGSVISYDSSGKPLWMCGTIQEITDFIDNHNFVNRVQKLESLGVLAGGIAHEFNNILTSVFGYIELAIREIDNDKAIGYLKSSLAFIDNAKIISNKLLTHAKGGDPVISAHNIEQFIHYTVKNIVKDKDMKVEINVKPDLWCALFDKNQMFNAFMNILQNSFDAMSGRDGVITVNATNISFDKHNALRPGKYVKISFIDDGEGIAAEIIDKVFDPFFTTRPSQQGLGLTTTYSIITKHHGCIEVESTIDVGTVITIYVPAES